MKKSLGDRMKGYENVNRNYLIKRMPVVIRLDGKAFHTYTRGCDKPYDAQLHEVRQSTLQYLCENIQGCIIGYSQSDELSLVLKDWQTFTTSAWFDNNLQKIVSVSASMCTMFWNREVFHNFVSTGESEIDYNAIFDSRAFNVPKEEVVNYLIWRQQDWERNSVQMLGQSLYSQKQLHGLSCPQIITKVEEEHEIVWGNLEPWKKQGEVWVKDIGIVPDFIFKNNREMLELELDYTNN
jgi:tRNA(His) guanylyltransferase